MAPLTLSFAQLRSENREFFAGLLMSWVHGSPSLPEFHIVEHQFLLCHYCDVALLVEVHFFVEVVNFWSNG